MKSSLIRFFESKQRKYLIDFSLETELCIFLHENREQSRLKAEKRRKIKFSV
jgi:hypothetical protein